ncbi:hypothetical protein H1R20_g3104, partial [Candolleomyces eurysporus]
MTTGLTAAAGNDDFENQLKRQRMMANNETKMKLLLGAGKVNSRFELSLNPSVSQSPVLKQMKPIHRSGYPEQETHKLLDPVQELEKIERVAYGRTWR